jgi:hypothetical protein
MRQAASTVPWSRDVRPSIVNSVIENDKHLLNLIVEVMPDAAMGLEGVILILSTGLL